MNVFNRVLLVVLTLVSAAFWAAIVIVVLLLPHETIALAKTIVLFLEANMGLYTQIMFGLLGAIFILASLLILVAELTPAKVSAVQLAQVESGVALLTTDAIAQRIRHDMEGLEVVHRIEPKVIARGKVVDIILEVRTGPESDVTATSEEVGRLVRDSVEKKMGARIGKLVMHL
ncbi:MAG: hypothetical protein ABIH46_12455, partial [Chloroflexota bacterium]